MVPFFGRAKRFSLQTVEGTKIEFAHARILMHTEYNCVANENCIATRLGILRVNQFMKEVRKLSDPLELVHEEKQN